MYTFKSYNQNAAAQSPYMGYVTSASATSVTAVVPSTTNFVIELEGMIKSNATTGGTLLPFLQTTGSSSTPVAQEFCSFQIVKLGATGTQNIAGNWA